MTTRRKKNNNNNKTKKVNNINKTRKISKNRSINGGGKKQLKTIKKKSKNRWGVPLERKQIRRTVHPKDLERALSQDPTRVHDISSDIRRIDGSQQNTSIKAKLAKKSDYKGKPLEKTGKRSIDNADACRFLDALFNNPDPYELILIEYRLTPGHMSNIRRLRFDLKALRPYIFGGINEEKFFKSVKESSALIKDGKVAQGRRIANSLNSMLKQNGSSFRLNPKISSKITSGETTKGQKRLQCGLKFDFADTNITKYVRELSPLSSENSPPDQSKQPPHTPTPRPSTAARSSAKHQPPKDRSASGAHPSSGVAVSGRPSSGARSSSGAPVMALPSLVAATSGRPSSGAAASGRLSSARGITKQTKPPQPPQLPPILEDDP
jgi:hypothetical protein